METIDRVGLEKPKSKAINAGKEIGMAYAFAMTIFKY